MTLQTCFAKVKNHIEESGLSENISTGRIRELARKLEAAGGDALTPQDFRDKTSDLLDEQFERDMAKARAEKAMFLNTTEKAAVSAFENTQKWQADIARGQAGKSSMMGVEAMKAWLLGGTARAGDSVNIDPAVVAKGVADSIKGDFNQAVGDTPGLKKIIDSGKMDRDMFIALDAIDRNISREGMDPMALEYAKAFKVARDAIFEQKQANNPWLDPAQNYLAKQFHDRARITADGSPQGKQAWIDMAVKTFGEKSYPELNPTEKIKTFGSIYDAISNGTWGTQQGDGAATFEGIPGDAGNIMRKQSSSRQLIAKDAQSFAEYQANYGPRTAMEGLTSVIDRGSKDIALLSKFTSQPELGYQRVFNRLASKLDGADLKNLQDAKPALDKLFRAVAQPSYSPADSVVAKTGQGLRAIEYMAKAGGSVFRAIPDIASGASLATDMDGHNLYQNAFSLATEVAKSFLPFGDASKRLNDLSMSSKAVNGELWNSLGAGQAAPGLLAKGAELMGSLTLHNRWVDSVRAGMAHLLSRRMGDIADTAHADLSPEWQAGLARYGIDSHAWDVMRLGAGDLNGSQHLTPDGIKGLPPEAIENYLRKSGQYNGQTDPSARVLDYGKSQLALKLTTLLNEHADLAASLPGTRQRTFLMWGGTDPNSGWGQTIQLMAQFKSAAVVQSDIYRRNYFSGQTMQSSYVGLANHVVGALFFSAMGEYLSQLSAGKTPEDPTTPQFAAKMAVGSGATGALGDVMVRAVQGNTVDSRRTAFSEALLGPALTDVGRGIGVGAGAMQAALGNGRPDRTLGGQAAGLATGLVPYNNLFYTKALFNFYLGNQLKEFMGPGYLGRLSRATAQTPAAGGGQQSYFMGKPGSSSFLGDN